MKKILCILIALVIIGNMSFAQNKPAKKPKPTNAAGAPAATKAATSAHKANPIATAKTKKDGTPDKRFKENKAAAKPAPKLKKDGTPDKRYKENKDPKQKK